MQERNPASSSRRPPSSASGGGRIGFPLSSEHCELLLSLETSGSLSGLARTMGRDVSVISRQLQKVAQLAPVLEKNQGKWGLTALGRQINNWTRDAAEAQKRLLRQRTVLRVASTREFAARVISVSFIDVLQESREPTGGTAAGGLELSILTAEAGIERLLLEGEADFGFDCGRPEDPMVRFRTGQTENFAIVASPAFIRKNGLARASVNVSGSVPGNVAGNVAGNVMEQLISLPHLRYGRISAARLLQLPQDVANVRAHFNDIACAREACWNGFGWAVLPIYAVQREIDSGLLKVIPVPAGRQLQTEQYGVWWLRSRKGVMPWIEPAWKWLQAQKL